LNKRRKKGFKEIQRQQRKSVFIGTGATDKRQHLHQKKKKETKSIAIKSLYRERSAQ
jgi:hypothetical protein